MALGRHSLVTPPTRCEEVLRPALPSHESPLLATLLRLYAA